MLRWQHLLLSALVVPLAVGVVFTLPTSAPIVDSKSEKVNSASISTVNSPHQKLRKNKDDRDNSAKSLLEQLNLTLQQKQQINRIRRDYQQQIGKRKDKLESLQQQLSQMMAGAQPAALVRLKNQELIVLRREIEQLRFESMLAAREILTLPQRQKFMEIVKDRRQQL
ncbi:Spy/CpxP family protein refolding chaperone [Myxosarcina sp. GI1(2024)]